MMIDGQTGQVIEESCECPDGVCIHGMCESCRKCPLCHSEQPTIYPAPTLRIDPRVQDVQDVINAVSHFLKHPQQIIPFGLSVVADQLSNLTLKQAPRNPQRKRRHRRVNRVRRLRP